MSQPEPVDGHWSEAPPAEPPFPDGPGDRLPPPRFRRGGDQQRGGRDHGGRDRDGWDEGARERGWGDSGFERVPPQDIDAEQSVLGGMLLSKDAIADVVEVLKAGDFYRPAHETVYNAILDLYARGEPADPITVAAELTKRGEITRVGGAAYLHTLVNAVPTAANAEYYAEIVHERAVLRRLVEAGTRITQMGYAADGDVDEIVNSAQAEIYAVTEQRTSEDYLPLSEIMEGALDEIEAIGSRSGQMTGVPTGFTDLDALTNGLHPGQMVVIAARPAMGKCLAAGSRVLEARSGEWITVEEFVRRGTAGEDLQVLTLGGDWKLRAARPSAYHHNGVKPVRKLRTADGATLRATGNHPMLTLRGWVPLERLRPGDHVAAPGGPSGAEGRPVPEPVWELIEAEKAGLTWAEVNERAGLPAGHDWRPGNPVDRARLLDLAKALDSRALVDLAESDVRWDRVVSNEPDGTEAVYDLTVEGTHSFVAEGLVVHNSTLALDFARSASIAHGLPSVFFSLEMGRNEIAMRLLSAEARVALHHMRSGNMTDDDWTRLARRMPEVSAGPLYIDDSPNLSMMEIRAKCRRLKQRNDLRLVVIDYLQLMQSGGSRRPESRQQEVSEMSRNLKLLAKELEVPVIALSQLNRGPEQRTDKKPMVSDLRESGSIEQDADMVILLHREDAYEKESPRAGEADLIVAKHRNGPTATITVAFQGHYSRFVDMAGNV
ncbi:MULTISPECIES: replicative DNA helicase [Streptomycetaceae]|uniref:Replicative DNA helicase n=1 Tax=Streptantibioticus cattleyicolor (strain ATCC 35852 / DSM 46488 / JCM 4925 / NBRC 14057 / NRRL 8057) TaxID=1003195 RepID=G8WX01_STREN|nr:replicative DNA helicase [Streptantibioticus cattleyicolor]AEW95515.1 replicative DNA helicase [Streptantibioticus cattleyicolor NRRL 8057 = DSM 46488]